MLTTLKGARAAVYYAAMALDAGVADATAASSAAKAFTGEGVAALAGEALQTHGGIGFTWEHDLLSSISAGAMYAEDFTVKAADLELDLRQRPADRGQPGPHRGLGRFKRGAVIGPDRAARRSSWSR